MSPPLARADVDGSAKPSEPSISVVIPSFDTRDLTTRCVEAIAGSPHVQDVLVVDDGSSDGTEQAILDLSLDRVSVQTTGGRLGFTRASNLGLERVEGRLMLLLNSDAFVMPGGLSHLVRAFDESPKLGIAGAELEYPDGSPQWSGGREPSLMWLFGLASSLPKTLAKIPGYRRLKPIGSSASGKVDWVSGCAMAIRCEAWLESGPFDERFELYAQDLDLCTRVRSKGWQVRLLPGFRVVHHHGETIGQLAGSIEARENPEKLWMDLVRWVEKNRGRVAAKRSRRAILAGARLRLAGRKISYAFLPNSRRKAWVDESETLHRACGALGSSRMLS